MNKKLQVFISSTYTDLIEERQAAVEAILDAGHIPAGMELFKAGKSQMKTIQKWIDDSDVYVLILGGRYGSIEKESGLSYTELEYKYALSKGMPVFAIVLNDSFLYIKAASKGKDNVFEIDNTDKYEIFKTFIKSNIVKFVTNTEEIKTIMHSQLNNIINDTDFNLTGWIRTNEKYTLSNIIHQYVNTQSLSSCIGLADALTTKLDKMLNFQNVIKKIKRFINISYVDDNFIKVTISNLEEYYCHSNKFKILFNATKNQAESYKVTQLKLNEKNYLPNLNINVERIENDNSFDYQVFSNEILLDISVNKIEYVCSYLSPINDFFISYRIHSPCYEFNVTINLNSTNCNYTILCSTFSSTERVRQKDYTDYEWHISNICDIKFPLWSLPGSGYTVTLKQGAE